MILKTRKKSDHLRGLKPDTFLIQSSRQAAQLAVLERLHNFVSNMEISRLALARLVSGQGDTDVDEECGYPDHIDFDMYYKMYTRDGISNRIVSHFPQESWQVKPSVYETEKLGIRKLRPFEKRWQELDEKHNLYGKCARLDEVAGIGHYGVMLIGINDRKPLSSRIDSLNEDGERIMTRRETPREILYLMPCHEGEARIEKFQTEKGSKRFGKPLYYSLMRADPTDPNVSIGREERVHWSRVIHVARNCTTSDIWGHPELESVYNYILNIRKILGGSAEMFWKGGFPGISFEVPPEIAAEVEIDKVAIEKEITKYMKRLKRYLALEGGLTAKTLQPNIEEPDTHFKSQITAISIAKKIPQRVLMGTEEARMASIQDAEAENKNVHGRQRIFCDPSILRPLVDRFQDMRVMPRVEKYFTTWPDLYAIAETDKADITGKYVRAMSEYITSGAGRLFPPLHFLTMMMNLSQEQAEEVIKEAKKEIKLQNRGQSIILPLDQLMNPGANGSNGKLRGLRPTATRSERNKVQAQPRSGRQATRPRKNSR